MYSPTIRPVSSAQLGIFEGRNPNQEKRAHLTLSKENVSSNHILSDLEKKEIVREASGFRYFCT